MDEEILKKYYASYSTILKILKLRGYKIPEKYDKTFEEFDEEFSSYETLSSFKTALSENMTFSDGLPTIAVFWIHDKKLGANIREIVSILEGSNTSNAFVVADEGPTPQVGETIKCVKIVKKINITVWSLKESMIFIPDHRLVPKHRICSSKEKKAFYAKYIIQDKQLPQIHLTDPMIKFIGAHKGDLIELTRINEYDSTKKSLSYRVVCQ